MKTSTTRTGWAPEVYTCQGAIGSEGCWERESHFSWGRGSWKIASVPVENNSRPRTYAYTGSTNWTWGLERWLSSQSVHCSHCSSKGFEVRPSTTSGSSQLHLQIRGILFFPMNYTSAVLTHELTHTCIQNHMHKYTGAHIYLKLKIDY